MARTLLNESNSTLRPGDGKRWKATLITPGQGSSGNYHESVLSRDAAVAFPAGTKLFFNHPAKGESAGSRDARDQWGFLPEDAYYEAGVGIVGEPEVLPHAREIVESLGTQAALSVWVMGESDTDGNVTALEANVTNSVDIVAYPGRPGSGLTKKMYEAFMEASETPGVTSAQEKKEGLMDKEILEALTALKVSFDTFVTESKAAPVEAPKAEADADAVEDAVTSAVEAYDSKVKEINATEGLLPAQVEDLLTAAKGGADVTPLIEKAKELADQAKKHFVENATVLNGHGVVGNRQDANFGVTNWGN